MGACQDGHVRVGMSGWAVSGWAVSGWACQGGHSIYYIPALALLVQMGVGAGDTVVTDPCPALTGLVVCCRREAVAQRVRTWRK